MPPSERQALERIVALAETQLDVIEDAAKRSSVDHGGLAQTSLQLLLQGMAAQLRGLALEPGTDPALAAKLKAFAERVDQHKARTVSVKDHLFELAEGWSCKHCGADVPSGAAISGVRVGQPRVELICRACTKTTRLTRDGEQVFEKRFGALLSESWNPALNGFVWNER